MRLRTKLAHTVDLHTLDIESAHSRHRHLCRSGVSMELLSAEALLQEARMLHTVKNDKGSEIGGAQKRQQTQPMTGFQLYHYLRMKCNNRGKWFTKQAWARSREIWSGWLCNAQKVFNEFEIVPMSLAQAAIRKVVGIAAAPKRQVAKACAENKESSDSEMKPLLPAKDSDPFPLPAASWMERGGRSVRKMAEAWDEDSHRDVRAKVSEDFQTIRHCHTNFCSCLWTARAKWLANCLNRIAATISDSQLREQHFICVLGVFAIKIKSSFKAPG